MKRILIIQYHSISHLNGAFKVADLLKKNGYDVYYFVNSKMVDYVQKHNFKYYVAKSHPIVEEYDEISMKMNKIDYTYLDRLKDGVMRFLFDVRKEDLTNVINKISPDIILEDTFDGTDFALLYPLLKKKGIRFFYIETMLSAINSKGIPYISGRSFPEEKTKIFLEHVKRKVTKGFKRFKRRVLYFGYDNYSVLKKEIAAQGLPEKYRIEKENYIDTAFTNITTLIMAPIELEFFTKPQNPYRHNLGFFINENSNNAIEVEDRLKKILDENKKIIYVSFGTVFAERESKKIASLMTKLNQVLPKFNDVVTIFTFGKADTNRQIQNLDHVHTFKFVPQVFLLNHCSIFVTHGGLNSVKESIEAAVPMLVYPFDIDQIGNARKVVHKKMGLLGDIKKETSADLESKIRKLLYDASFKQNIQSFKEEIAKKYDLEKLLIPIIENEGIIE